MLGKWIVKRVRAITISSLRTPRNVEDVRLFAAAGLFIQPCHAVAAMTELKSAVPDPLALLFVRI